LRRLDKCLLFYRGLTPCTFQPFLACGAYRRTDTHGQSKAPYTLSVKLSDFVTSYPTEKLSKLRSFDRQ